ncbi:Gx transporter family protein [Halanaerobacter jeridensis]|uniref:Heptaprenyl diphosphate synthase n=1 Tax=Halanaerobacter jeridensis TaxID=706427 RepID=A0A939BP25_9FIRM|nr:Gx transporter family protein [Halanaerobacter jeridensis]MBM7556178.1 heptaprenyl diphosphate synthase [Halanaerobacter jeridensis]
MIEMKRNVTLGLFVASAIVLHIIEFILPTTLLFPGAKLGLANIITLLVLIDYGFVDCLKVVLMRIILSSLLSGTFFTISFWLSLAGGILSLLIMGYLYYNFQEQFSLIGISVLGAASHNLAQIGMAFLLIENWRIIFYLPYLLLLSLPTGVFVALVVMQLKKYLQ